MATLSTIGDVTNVVLLKPGEKVQYTKTAGGGAGSLILTNMRLEKSKQPDTNFSSVTDDTDSGSTTGVYRNRGARSEHVRCRLTAIDSTSSDMTTVLAITDGGPASVHFDGARLIDERGEEVASFDINGASFPGTLDVTGDVAAGADINVVKTVTAGSATEYGFVHSTGLYDDLEVNLTAVRVPASGGPGIDLGTGIPMFDKNSEETMPFNKQVPHSWKSGGTLEVHCHAYADQSTDPAASPEESQSDGVFTESTLTLTSAAATFTGMEGQFITVSGGSAQIETVTDANNVVLASDATDLFDDAESGITYNVYLDTVVLKLQYAIKDVNDYWDQATYTTITKTCQLGIHSTNAKHNLLDIGEIDCSDFQDSAVIHGIISRAGDSTEDKYDDDLHLAQIDFHAKINTFGSLNENGEDF